MSTNLFCCFKHEPPHGEAVLVFAAPDAVSAYWIGAEDSELMRICIAGHSEPLRVRIPVDGDGALFVAMEVARALAARSEYLLGS